MNRDNMLRREPTAAVDSDWGLFPGGELEGARPRALCPACRQALRTAALGVRATGGRKPPHSKPTLCFQCYRVELERSRALKAAGEINTASEARFQTALPFETVNQVRLDRLKAERHESHTRLGSVAQFADRRRRAQIAARHALEQVVSAVKRRGSSRSEANQVVLSSIHAAELQLPEAWLPFVVTR